MNVWKKFSNWYLGNNDTEHEVPEGGIPRVLYIIRNYTGKLVLVNILFVVTSLPLVTLPLTLLALSAYLMKIWRVGYGIEVGDYFAAVRKSLKQAPAVLVSLLVAFAGYYVMSMAGNVSAAGSSLYAVMTGMGFALFLLGIALTCYSSVMGSILDLQTGGLLQNAWILLYAEPKATLTAVIAWVAAIFLVLTFMPWSLIVAAVIGASIPQLCACAAIGPVIQRRILDPYEKQQEH